MSSFDEAYAARERQLKAEAAREQARQQAELSAGREALIAARDAAQKYAAKKREAGHPPDAVTRKIPYQHTWTTGVFRTKTHTETRYKDAPTLHGWVLSEYNSPNKDGHGGSSGWFVATDAMIMRNSGSGLGEVTDITKAELAYLLDLMTKDLLG